MIQMYLRILIIKTLFLINITPLYQERGRHSITDVPVIIISKIIFQNNNL